MDKFNCYTEVKVSVTLSLCPSPYMLFWVLMLIRNLTETPYTVFPLAGHPSLHLIVVSWTLTEHSVTACMSAQCWAQTVWLTTLSYCHMSCSLKNPVHPLCPSVPLFVSPRTPLNPA